MPPYAVIALPASCVNWLFCGQIFSGVTDKCPGEQREVVESVICDLGEGRGDVRNEVRRSSA
ncbi:hypothetical protein PC128_g24492 [Phytophthora cactorum]|nr:hypothetical protein PC120_g25325 [Phytophthora cactorum]KAG3143961.1 hypothetical protein PC128_g24492 [Phytophthora cactorum]KAG4039163.1 hypothetical protein PC123_g25283 [Phytophthora cactorum]